MQMNGVAACFVPDDAGACPLEKKNIGCFRHKMLQLMFTFIVAAFLLAIQRKHMTNTDMYYSQSYTPVGLAMLASKLLC